MSMNDSLARAVVVGSLKDFFKRSTIERLTFCGGHVIDHDSQEKSFWFFPNKSLVLLSISQFDPNNLAEQGIEMKDFLMLRSDFGKEDVFEEIQKTFTEIE